MENNTQKEVILAEVEALSAEWLETEASLMQLAGRTRSALARTEDLARRAQIELERRHFQAYTESQVADIFQVSIETIARLRKGGRIPYLPIGSLVRYTHGHLHEIGAALERTPRAKKR